MTTRTRKTADARKKQIVDTAIRLAGKVGPDRLTTQQLADDIGISQPAVFRHFPTKGAIWQAVAERIAQSLRATATRATQPDRPAAEQLQKLVAAQLRFIKSNPAVPAILFSRELHSANDTLRAFFARLMAGRHAAFSRLIAQEIESGGFIADLNPDDAAYLILALIQGLAMRWSLSARAFDLPAEGERLLTLQLQAFR